MIDLKQFCSKDDTRSKAIGQPWSDGPWTFATNGHVIVRVPCRDDVPYNPYAPKSANMIVFEGSPNDGEFRELPPFTAPKVTQCELCVGSGRCECTRCKFEHDCGDCNGTGLIEEYLPGVKFGEQFVSPKYLAMIATLPNAKLANGVDKENALTFTFDGGEGRLMPLRES